MEPREDELIAVNGREYALPRAPAAVICLDGADPAYLEAALDRGLMPALASWPFRVTARGVLPSFTNPNNVSNGSS